MRRQILMWTVTYWRSHIECLGDWRKCPGNLIKPVQSLPKPSKVQHLTLKIEKIWLVVCVWKMNVAHIHFFYIRQKKKCCVSAYPTDPILLPPSLKNEHLNQCFHEITYKIKIKNQIYYRLTDPNFFGNVSGNSTLIFFGLIIFITCFSVYGVSLKGIFLFPVKQSNTKRSLCCLFLAEWLTYRDHFDWHLSRSVCLSVCVCLCICPLVTF